ncbi:hypothetical protein FMUND_13424 [Fusarium mundagurra]|uniref:Uncharacterized protein n=1 Tax=Fusarium mundagurra TaxID=1567541 RepID=A0A8H5XZ70_9HYPO|nr:hypothetical protein FMUND_13424 [Fusarium mundagurra]
MKLISISFALLAALGAQAMPTNGTIDGTAKGTFGTLALGRSSQQQCTGFGGQCLVNGRRQICNVGKVPSTTPLSA